MRLTNGVKMVFDNMNVNEDQIKSLMFDLGTNKEIFDAESNRVVSKREAEDKLLTFSQNVLGLDKNSSKRDIKRAMQTEDAKYLFWMMEEVVDFKVQTGIQENEFFNAHVNQRYLNRGDDIEFYSEKNVILTVAKVAGDHHDFIMQTLGEGESYTIATSVYGMAVGMDIALYVTGKKSFADLTDKIAEAFMIKIQNDLYGAVMSAGAKLPVAEKFNKAFAINKTNKAVLDEMIEDVASVNGTTNVFIMGTRTALKQLNNLADVDWADEGTKKQISTMGRLGSYETTTLIEIPQRYVDETLTAKVFDNKKLLIFADNGEALADFVDVGDTEILEVNEVGATQNDIAKYEVTRRMGIAVHPSNYFGTVTITE